MQSKPKNIGEFYKESLENLDIKRDNSEWLLMEAKIAKMQFLKFGWSFFNIYYASFIAGITLISSAALINYLLLQNPEEQTPTIKDEMELKENTNSIINKDSLPVENNNEKNKENQHNTNSARPLLEENTILNEDKPIESGNTDHPVKDSIPMHLPDQQPEPELKPKVIQKDTLPAIDSSKTKKDKDGNWRMIWGK